MFRKFGYQFAGSDNAGEWGQGWTPPWMEDAPWHGRRGHHEHHGPRGPVAFAMRRRGGPFGGPFGHGGPFGGGSPFGGGEGGRFFGRGDMKFALLVLLRERPMYGYEMIKALEERSGGFYTPSPGSIYPTLQMLEERGFVTASEVEGKKVYSISETGRTLLEEHQQQQEFSGPPWMRHRHGHEGQQRGPRPEMQALRLEAMEVARLFALAGRGAITDPEKLTRLRSIIERTRKELTGLIYGEAEAQPSSEQPPVE
jgi:DNA-binding PadR family transcriptional regulator